MVDRSASDREGAGSNPASGLHSASPGYAGFQLARALAAAEAGADPEARERARSRAEKWGSVLRGMASGELRVGSRTPSEGVPAWATLEVLTGGFATGMLLAGGPLREHEQALALRLGIPPGDGVRLALNGYFLSEAGVSELQDRLKTGTFEVDVPEEGALPVMAWLLGRGEVARAREVLARIEPFLPRLCFYPRFVERPRRWGTRAHVQDVKSAIQSLEAIGPSQHILTQRETIRVWIPLYDEAVALLLETVEGEAPRFAHGPGAGPVAPRPVVGGWPCRRYPDGWSRRAGAWLGRVAAARAAGTYSARASHRKSSLAQLLPLIAKCAVDPRSLTGPEVGRIRLVLARYVAKHGTPDSATCRGQRGLQDRQARTPLLSSLAGAVISRLRPLPADEGVDSTDAILAPLGPHEAAPCGVDAGTALPECIRRKAQRCLNESVEVLVERGLITSGDALAKVLPQITSGIRSMGIGDPELRPLYAAIDRAFRARRSLLLLDLQSQVKIHELPWVEAIEPFRDGAPSAKRLARQVLVELVGLALTSFPQAILPNKMLQEIGSLAKAAEVRITLVDELAADIFMGRFSPKFTAAAKTAGALLRGSLYARYYGIDFDRIADLPDEEEPKRTFWGLGPKKEPSSAFGDLCAARAGLVSVLGDPAANGMIIEQQQILTTQNLAVLVSALDLRTTLGPHLIPMATRCFTWICRALSAPARDWHTQLIAVKNSAYAWRQMIFFLSIAPPNDLGAFMLSAEGLLGERPEAFRRRFAPAMAGLHAALGNRPAGEAGRIFLGWAKDRHWLVDPQAHPNQPPPA